MKILMSTHFQKPLGDQKHPMFPSLLSLLSCEDCLLKTLPDAEALQEDVLGTSLGWVRANLGSSSFDYLYNYFAIKTRKEQAVGNSDKW